MLTLAPCRLHSLTLALSRLVLLFPSILADLQPHVSRQVLARQIDTIERLLAPGLSTAYVAVKIRGKEGKTQEKGLGVKDSKGEEDTGEEQGYETKEEEGAQQRFETQLQRDGLACAAAHTERTDSMAADARVVNTEWFSRECCRRFECKRRYIYGNVIELFELRSKASPCDGPNELK